MILKKTLAAAAVASLLVPMAASAHGLSFGVKANDDSHANLRIAGFSFGAGLNASSTVGHKDDGDKNDEQDHRSQEHATSTLTGVVKGGMTASTSAAVLTMQANRLSAVADFMGSLSSVLSARIASSSLSASSTAQAQAALSAYNTDISQAKAKIAAALSSVAQLSASTSTSTDKTIASQVRADLTDARKLLNDARKDFHTVLRIALGITVKF